MATPHSLPSNSQRIASQLPFSPSPSTTTNPTIQRLQSQSRQRSGSTADKSQHTRSGSITSSHSRTQNPLSPKELFSSPPPLPLFPPRAGNIGPNATGIQPSAGFFHPQRPNHGATSPTTWVRPSSPGSMVSSDVHSAVPVHLAPFTRQDTETDGTESIGLSSTEDLNYPSLRTPSKSTKYSREPLLPLGVSQPRASTTSSRPSGPSTGPYGRSDTNVSTGARMRGSFEKLFKRGLSFEGGKRPSPIIANGATSSEGDSPTNCITRSRQASPITPSANGHMTFDLTAHDDDHAPISPLARYKNNTAQPRASTPSLNELPFNPVPPPDMKPPLAETPRVDTKTGRKVRNYELHASRNRFFVQGRVLTGGDTPWAFVASLVVVLGITGVWFSTTCVWWWLNESPAVAAVGAYMCLLTISSMFATVRGG